MDEIKVIDDPQPKDGVINIPVPPVNPARVLSLGDPTMANQLFPDAQIDVVDQVRTKLPARYSKIQYDSIVSYLALPYIHYRNARKVIGEWAGYLKPGGSMHIFVPSLEWAAEQILSEEPSNAVHAVLYGGHYPNNFMCGYTMMDVRTLCEMNGLAVIYARVGTYQLQEGENLYVAETNYVMAVKPKKEKE